MSKKSKQPTSNYSSKISSEKTPRIDKNKEKSINNTRDHNPVWQFKYVDLEHDKWGWKKLDAKKTNEILTKLKNYETMTWKEIHGNYKRDHTVSIERLDKSAQSRLTELGLDDLDELLRLRFSGKERIWGILDNYIFKILWWDPEHTVCPSEKKHT